jgi:hypothetical protein
MMRSQLFFAAALASPLLSASSPAETPPESHAVQTAPAPQVPPSVPAEPSLPSQASDDWKVYAKPAEVVKISTLDAVWDKAISAARAEGYEADLDKLGALAKRGGGLAVPFAAPGAYRCRMIDLGGSGHGPAFTESSSETCQIELTPGGDLVLRRLSGMRFEGKLYPERPTRLVYLGAMVMDGQPTAYGRAAEYDQLGVFERIGEGRYRLTLVPMNGAEGVTLVELVK